MFSKVDVNGPNAHPVWKFLKSNQAVGTHDIGWNFDKFLVNKDGHVTSAEVSVAIKAAMLEQFGTLAGLLSSGAALVTTSNSEPDDLYPGGLNRSLYIPMLVKTLSQHRVMPQLVRPAGGDYRRKKAAASEEAASSARFFRPADQRAAAALGAAVAELGRAKETMDEVVPLPGRRAGGQRRPGRLRGCSAREVAI